MHRAKLVKFNVIKSGVVGLPDMKAIGYLDQSDLIKNMNSFQGTPIFIGHQDYSKIKSEEELEKSACGYIMDTNYNVKTGWLEATGLVKDKKALDLLNKGVGVSCSYMCNPKKEEGLANSIPYTLKIQDPKFIDLCIVENPRYAGAKALEVINELKIENANASNIQNYNISESLNYENTTIFSNYVPSQYMGYSDDFNTQVIPIARDEGGNDEILAMFENLLERTTAEALGIDWDDFLNDVESWKERSKILLNASTDPKKIISNAKYVLIDGVPMLLFLAIKLYLREMQEQMQAQITQPKIKSISNSLQKGDFDEFFNFILNEIIPESKAIKINGVSVLIAQIVAAVKRYNARMKANQLMKENQKYIMDKNNLPNTSPFQQKSVVNEGEKQITLSESALQKIIANALNEAKAEAVSETEEVIKEEQEVVKKEKVVENEDGKISMSAKELQALIENAAKVGAESVVKAQAETKQKEVDVMYNSFGNLGFEKQLELEKKRIAAQKQVQNEIDDNPEFRNIAMRLMFDETDINL